MPDYYFDSSALLKRFKTELGSDLIWRLLTDREPGEHFFTSSFTPVECVSALTRLKNGRLISNGAYLTLLDRLNAETERFELTQISDAVLTDAIRAAKEHGLKGADALQLASAVIVNRQTSVQSLVFVSADKDLLVAVSAEGIETLDPQESDAANRLERFRSQP